MKLKTKTIYLDCFAGISGNMLLGALIDAGVSEEELRAELAKLPVTGYQLNISKVEKAGISAVYLDVQLDNAGHHHHRNIADIYAIIDNSSLKQNVKDKSKHVFMRLAQAEAKVHGVSVNEIHFHEVGAVDSIIDIIGTVWALDDLGIEKIYASKLHVGSGFVNCCHGTIPVPAPATAELLHGIPHYQGNIEKELVTPTGAAILSALGSGFGYRPENFISSKIGYGAGTWELDIPNVLRLYVGEIEGQEEPVETGNECLVGECNIDDQKPEFYSYVMDKLFAAGALDVWLTPIVMKKGRPATKLSVLIDAESKAKIADIILTETTSIGIRYYPVSRVMADRELIIVGLPWGDVQVKISSYQGKICNVAPEYEDCRKVAEESGLPLKVIYDLALKEAMSYC